MWFGTSPVRITAVVPSNEIETPVPENCENMACVDVDDVVGAGVVGVVGAGVGVDETGVALAFLIRCFHFFFGQFSRFDIIAFEYLRYSLVRSCAAKILPSCFKIGRAHV